MTNNVVPIPVSHEQRKLNEYGEGYVPCAFTEKWLQFPDKVVNESHIPVKVMAELDGEERQLTQVIISKEDLLRAVNAMELELNEIE